MTKPNYTHLSLIVDRSGSMVSIKDDAEGGINTLIKEQAEVPGEITVSLYHFDTVYEKVFGPIPASDAPVYRLVPRGGTALLDATAKAIVETGEFLAGLPENQRPDKVIFVVATDGQENSSREYNRQQVKDMVDVQTKDYKWEFIYLGANVNAFAEAHSLGFAGSSQYQGTGASTRGVYGAASTALRTARVGGQSMASSMVDVDEDGNPVSPAP